MPVLPDIPTGWTKARIWEKYQQLLDDRDQVRAERDELQQLLADEDHEARALGSCINALDAMLVTVRERTEATSRRAGGAMYAELRHTTPERPAALDSPVGRILLHLAARYDVDVVAPAPGCPEPEPTLADDGQALMVVPQKLAATIQQLLEHQPWIADQVAPR